MGSSANNQFLIINLASVPDGHLINSPTAQSLNVIRYYTHLVTNAMNLSKRTFNFSSWLFVFFMCLAAVLAYLLKKYSQVSLFNSIAIIILAIGGLTLITTASIYGFLENKYGKEENQDSNSNIIEYYKRVNKIFLLSQGVCAISIFSILCLVSPYYPLFLLTLYAVFVLIHKLKSIKSK